MFTVMCLNITFMPCTPTSWLVLATVSMQKRLDLVCLRKAPGRLNEATNDGAHAQEPLMPLFMSKLSFSSRLTESYSSVDLEISFISKAQQN